MPQAQLVHGGTASHRSSRDCVCVTSTLNLGNNKLSGTLPASLTMLSRLTGMFLTNNALSSTVPSTITVLTNLRYAGGVRTTVRYRRYRETFCLEMLS